MAFTEERLAQLETMLAKTDVNSRFGKYQGNDDLNLLNKIFKNINEDSNGDGKADWENGFQFNRDGSSLYNSQNGINKDYDRNYLANTSWGDSFNSLGLNQPSVGWGISDMLKFFDKNNFRDYQKTAKESENFLNNKYDTLSKDIFDIRNNDINRDYGRNLNETRSVLAGRGLNNSAILARLENRLNERKDNAVSGAVNTSSRAVNEAKDYTRSTRENLVQRITDGFGADVDVNGAFNDLSARIDIAKDNNTISGVGNSLGDFAELNNYRNYNNGASRARNGGSSQQNGSPNYFNNAGYNGRN